jgi:hypothetical protein
MKRTRPAAWILCVALTGDGGTLAAASVSDGGTQCSVAHLKQLKRGARTQEQYKVLAVCYEMRQKRYLDQAAREKQEWERRSRNMMAMAAKYPRPVDSALNLYEYYMAKASEAEKLSSKFSQLARP